MPTSTDPEKRQRQLANLRPGAKPAPTGNRRAVRHGAYGRSDEGRLAEKRTELRELLAADAPLRDVDGGLPRHDELAVSLLAETLTRLDAVRSYLDLHGVLTEKGKPRPAAALEDRLNERAFRMSEALGMTPASRAKLGLNVAKGASLDEEMTEARKARERAEARREGVGS